MTDRFYSVALGEQTTDKVTEGSSTSSEAIELRVAYDTTGLNKLTVLNGLKALQDYITKDTWPPT